MKFRHKKLARQAIHSNPEMIQILYECGCEDKEKVYHHFDYSRPYEVIKLCNECHGKEHKRLNRLIMTNEQNPDTNDFSKIKQPYPGIDDLLIIKINQRMQEKGWKQQHLAEKCPNVSQATISRFFNGKTPNPSSRTLKEIQSALDIKLIF